MNEEELTGDRRFRECTLFENHDYQNQGMVLQVEVSNWDDAKKKWVLSYRDAKPSDLTKQVNGDYYV